MAGGFASRVARRGDKKPSPKAFLRSKKHQQQQKQETTDHPASPRTPPRPPVVRTRSQARMLPIRFHIPSPLASLTPSRKRRAGAQQYQSGWWLAPKSPSGDTPKPKAKWRNKKQHGKEVRI